MKKQSMASAAASMMPAILLTALGLMLTACMPGGTVQTRIPLVKVEANRNATNKTLVVVLPGRGDDVTKLKASGIAEAIQSSMPGTDVVLAGVSLAYYMEGRMPQRLHEEIFLPARSQGYQDIWLVGASMGGMGALMYDRQYPGDAAGLVLLAPYMGSRKVLREIEASGGLSSWDAGPVPESVDGNNYDRELWRYLKTWQGSKRGDDVWLAYGDTDRLRAAMPPLQKLLGTGHVSIRSGGHAWAVWTPAAKEIFESIARQQRQE